MASTDEQQEFATLLERYLTDDLDDPGRGRLRAMIERDSELCVEFVSQGRTDAALGAMLGGGGGEAIWQRLTRQLGQLRPSQRRRNLARIESRVRRLQLRRRRRSTAAVWSGVLLAAAAVLAVLLWSQRLGPASTPQAPTSVDTLVEAAPPRATPPQAMQAPAQSAGEEPGRWRLQISGRARVQRGGTVLAGSAVSAVDAGDRIDLLSGSAELTAGADRLQLDGPSSLQLVSTDDHQHRLQLQGGRLLAELQRRDAAQSVRFTAPHAAIEVVGTRFSVLARREASEIKTQRGAVRVGHASGSDWLVTAGSAVRATAAGLEILPFSIDFERELGRFWADHVRRVPIEGGHALRVPLVYGAGAFMLRDDSAGPLMQAHKGMQLSFRYRYDGPPVDVRFQCFDPLSIDGAGDNYHIDFTVLPGAWRSFSFPLSALRANVDEISAIPPGCGLYSLQIFRSRRASQPSSMLIDDIRLHRAR